jgi:hypothetical protein
MTVVLPAGESVEQLRENALFLSVLREAIATNLPSAAELGITVADVSIELITLLSTSGGRRLEFKRAADTAQFEEGYMDDSLSLRGLLEYEPTAEERRLARTGTFRIDYKVKMQDDAAVYQLKDEILMKKVLYKRQIKEAIEANPDLQIEVQEISVGTAQKSDGWEQEPDPEEDDGALSTGSIAGIIIGVVGGCMTLVAIGVFILFKRRYSKKPEEYVVK